MRSLTSWHLRGATNGRAGAGYPLDREPDLVVVVQLDGGVCAFTGDVADFAETERRLHPLADGELRKERLPERRNIGERERSVDVRPLVTPVGYEDAGDAVEVRARDLRDQTRPHGLPYQLLLELRVLLATPPQNIHHPRERPTQRFLDRQPVDAALVNMRIEPLLLPSPRDTEPILPEVVLRLCHAAIIPH